MNIRIEKSRAQGTVQAPPSKSVAHRYLIGGGLSAESCVRGIAPSEDMLATLDCLMALGAGVRREGEIVSLGGADPFRGATTPLGCRESGSTLRFMLPLCLLGDRPVTLGGSARLFQRSLSVYETLCADKGLFLEKRETAVTVRGPLTAGRYAVRGDVSSQFISGLMLALPLLEGDSELVIEGALESTPYLRLTAQAMAAFGVKTEWTEPRRMFIPGSQRYESRTLMVEGDYSNAAFLEGFNLLGGRVTVTGLAESTAQGDAVYRQLFPQLAEGCPTVDISDCPDLGPVLMALGAAGHGVHLTGARRLRIKESDRGNAMAAELEKCGIRCRVEENDIFVERGLLYPPAVPLSGHNDHRIVMALSLLCTLVGGEICGAEAVTKSFPDFFERLAALGVCWHRTDTMEETG